MSNNDNDRLSSLSNDLLYEILSFLDTKYAVRTCVLSKRWNKLWKSLCCLNFQFVRTTRYPTETMEANDHHCSINFIDQMLELRNPIKLFKVRFSSSVIGNPHPSVVERLISHAIVHKVQDLDIHLISLHEPIMLPERFYTCSSLTALKLEIGLNSPQSRIFNGRVLSLPALKSLYLGGFTFIREDNFDPFYFCGCPNLESLKICDTLFVNYDKAKSIQGFNLKHLEFSYSRDFNWYHYKSQSKKIAIFAPRLTTFKYHGYASLVVDTAESFSPIKKEKDKILPSSVHVHFELFPCLPPVSKEDYFLDLVNTFKVFSHAKSLTLSSSTVEILSEFPLMLEEQGLSYHNLKQLRIKTVGDQKFHIPRCVKNCFLNDSTILLE